MDKVKCADCGFLASRNVQSRQLEETESVIRSEGSLSIVWNTGRPTNLYEPPICFMQVPDFKAIPYSLQYSMQLAQEKEKVHSEIQRERECELFTEWRLGSTPKEHQEMIDREARLKWQAEREAADREWRDDQRKVDKHWRIIELIVFGVISVLVAGGFTLLGAFISRGGH